MTFLLKYDDNSLLPSSGSEPALCKYWPTSPASTESAGRATPAPLNKTRGEKKNILNKHTDTHKRPFYLSPTQQKGKKRKKIPKPPADFYSTSTGHQALWAGKDFFISRAFTVILSVGNHSIPIEERNLTRFERMFVLLWCINRDISARRDMVRVFLSQP